MAYNRSGTFDMPGRFSSTWIAYPAPEVGVVTVCDFASFTEPISVHAFRTPIIFLRFSDNGRILAVAGDEGKTIKLYTIPHLTLLRSLVRVKASQSILSLSFETNGTQLGVTSKGGALNLFNLCGNPTEEDPIKGRAVKDEAVNESYVSFSPSSLRLHGVSSTGMYYIIRLNDHPDGSKVDVIQERLNLAPAN